MNMMRKMWRALVQQVAAIHRDERGAEGLEKLLIVAAIVLPLLGILIFFRDELTGWVGETFTDVRNDAGQNLDNPFDGGTGSTQP